MISLADADPAIEKLLCRYLEVFNQALVSNRVRFPYRQMWDAVQLEDLKLKICVTLVGAGNDISATVVLRNGELGLMPDTCCGCVRCYGEERCWAIERDEIDMIVNHPQLYISQPARLNWDWMTPGGVYLSEHGKPELQAGQAYSESCSKDFA